MMEGGAESGGGELKLAGDEEAVEQSKSGMGLTMRGEGKGEERGSRSRSGEDGLGKGERRKKRWERGSRCEKT